MSARTSERQRKKKEKKKASSKQQRLQTPQQYSFRSLLPPLLSYVRLCRAGGVVLQQRPSVGVTPLPPTPPLALLLPSLTHCPFLPLFFLFS
jgi:hypothetical protein